jgi:hypothetical protein
MPETASSAHMLAPVKPVNESGRNLKPDSVSQKLKSNSADSAINDDNSIPEQSDPKTERGSEDFDKVLSRKIDRQKEQMSDEHPQENTASAETDGLSLIRYTGCSDCGHGNNPLGNMGGQSASEQAIAETSNPLKNTGGVQLAANAGIMGEAMNPESQANGQLSDQTQGVGVQPTVSLESREMPVHAEVTVQVQGVGVQPTAFQESREAPVHAEVTVELKLPVDGKQVHAQKPVMTESPDISENNNTDNKRAQTPEATEQALKQLSNAPDSEVQPLRTNQNKPVHPDFQAVFQGTRGEQRQDFSPKPDTPETPDQFQDKTQILSDLQGVPVESEAFFGEHDEIPKGFGIRNVQSMLHSAEPSENASLSALEAPARTGNHSNISQAEAAKPVDQILQHLSSISVSGAQQRIKLTLTPEDLGTIRITFNQTEDEVVGILEVQKNQTRRQVEQALPQLISAMQSSGVQVRKIEVVQWNTSQDSAEDGTTKDPDYSAAGQFYDESSPHSSESEMSENIHSAGGDQKSSQLSGISGLESPIDGVGTTENGLNMFI